VIGPFTTREIATGIWIALFLAYAFTESKVRHSVARVFRLGLKWKVLLTLLGVAVYTGAIVAGLRLLELWNPSMLKDTIVWFLFYGIALAFSGITAGSQVSWRAVVREQIKAIIVVEYLANTYTFSLFVELVLVPVITVVALLDVMARTRPEYARVKIVTGPLQSLFGLAVLGSAIYLAWATRQTFDASQAFLDIALAPLLSVLLVPVVYFFALWSAYVQVFIKLRIPKRDDARFVRYARARLFRYLGLRLGKIWRFNRDQAFALMAVNSKAELNALLRGEIPQTLDAETTS